MHGKDYGRTQIINSNIHHEMLTFTIYSLWYATFPKHLTLILNQEYTSTIFIDWKTDAQ